jgi:hypothetical protein
MPPMTEQGSTGRRTACRRSFIQVDAFLNPIAQRALANIISNNSPCYKSIISSPYNIELVMKIAVISDILRENKIQKTTA